MGPPASRDTRQQTPQKMASRHEWRPTTFTLVVDDFGVKYVGKEHADHLVASLKTKYKLVEDWAGDLYWGIKLHWDYTACTLDILMP